MRLATELASGHDATAAALDEGLLSPAHAAVIVEADRQLPPGLSDAQRQVVEAALVVKARRSTPEQLRREARRALAAIEPDQQVVDAHENDLVRTEEDLARDRCALTLHDNGRHQALALGLRHDTCAAEGCERPYAWCELHHRHPWTSGGRSDLDNAVPLCHFHHQRIHDHTYHHRRQPDGTLRFRRRRSGVPGAGPGRSPAVGMSAHCGAE